MTIRIDIFLVFMFLIFAFGFGMLTAIYVAHMENYVNHPLTAVNHYACSLDWNYTTPNSYTLQINYSGAVVRIKENC